MGRKKLFKNVVIKKAREWDFCSGCDKKILAGQKYYHVTQYTKYHLTDLAEKYKPFLKDL